MHPQLFLSLKYRTRLYQRKTSNNNNQAEGEENMVTLGLKKEHCSQSFKLECQLLKSLVWRSHCMWVGIQRVIDNVCFESYFLDKRNKLFLNILLGRMIYRGTELHSWFTSWWSALYSILCIPKGLKWYLLLGDDFCSYQSLVLFLIETHSCILEGFLALCLAS